VRARQILYPGSFTILAYHRILAVNQEEYPFDPEVISVTPEELEREIRWLKQYFTIVTFAELAAILERNRKPPPNLLLMTFDDGYRDNYTTVYPILRAYEVPATLFLVPGFIETGVVPWWDRVCYYFKHTPRREVWLTEWGPLAWPLKDRTDRERAAREMIALLKSVEDGQREQLLTALEAECEVAWPPEMSRDLFLTWDEVREMVASGFEIGAHTLTHPILTTVFDETRLRHEIAQSKLILEQEVEQEVLAFAYPAGRFNPLVERLVQDAGYQFAVSCCAGRNQLSNYQPFALRRLKVETGKDFNRFRAKLALPEVVIY